MAWSFATLVNSFVVVFINSAPFHAVWNKKCMFQFTLSGNFILDAIFNEHCIIRCNFMQTCIFSKTASFDSVLSNTSSCDAIRCNFSRTLLGEPESKVACADHQMRFLVESGAQPCPRPQTAHQSLAQPTTTRDRVNWDENAVWIPLRNLGGFNVDN